jgi:hypothetical protein
MRIFAPFLIHFSYREDMSSGKRYHYRASVKGKEFEFDIEIPPNESNPHTCIARSVSAASPSMFKQVQPQTCVGCGKPAKQFQHNMNFWENCDPMHVEDMPQAVCGESQCIYIANQEMREGMERHGIYPQKTKAGCSFCNAVADTMMQCSRCKAARYCGPQCQRAHWPTHKPTCSPPPK